MANDTTPYLMVLLLNNDVWCKSREVVVLRNLIEQAWGKVLDEDNSITYLVVYPEVLTLVFDAANTYNAEPGVLEQTARAERGGVHTAQPRGLDLFNCVNRASPRKTLMHHLTLKVTTPKMTFNGTM